MTEWQPIETAPRPWTPILAYDPTYEDGAVTAMMWNPDWQTWAPCVGDENFAELRPTHWMPLPDPPGGDNG